MSPPSCCTPRPLQTAHRAAPGREPAYPRDRRWEDRYEESVRPG